ncbi:MAG: PocR ligand-binding domain-containing protein [Candidatus Omnitrophica bacterium]|nr:PocR ligand-binding domain-containing protein [Candidatus Omnitrophota bacterium]
MADNLDFKNLIGLEAWQEIQNNFSAVTQIPMRTVDLKGKPLTKPSGVPHLCSDYIAGFPHLLKACSSCMPTFLGGNEQVDSHLSYSCFLGLRNFIAALRIDQYTPLAYVIIGPVVLINYKPKSYYEKIAADLNLNINDLYSAVTDVKLSSFNSMLSVVELIQDVGNYLIKAAYKTFETQIGTGNLQLDKLNRLLQVFLDVAFQVSGADSGSIMLLDKTSKELSILTSKGIEKEIIKNSRIKFGEGISGTVAKENTPILINDRISHNRIKSYLNRPGLKTSMVLPIRVKEDVLGVINLNTSQGSQIAFSPNDLKIMDRLVDLVSVALH